MNQECTTHTPDTEQNADPLAELRKELRPVTFVDELGKHPDGRPCPPWCYVLMDADAGHELDPKYPTTARHELDRDVRVRASLYPGWSMGDNKVSSACIHVGLSRLGTAVTTVRVALDTGDDRLRPSSVMRLTLPDARDLIKALEAVVAVGEQPTER